MLPCPLHAKHVLISSHVPILSPPSLLVYSHDNLHLPDFILLLVFRNFMKNRMSCFTIWYEQFGDLWPYECYGTTTIMFEVIVWYGLFNYFRFFPVISDASSAHLLVKSKCREGLLGWHMEPELGAMRWLVSRLSNKHKHGRSRATTLHPPSSPASGRRICHQDALTLYPTCSGLLHILTRGLSRRTADDKT